MSPRVPLSVRLLAAAAAAVIAAQLARQPETAGVPETALASEQVAVSKAHRPLKKTLVEIAFRIADDNLTLVAAGVAFYGFLALFPAAAALVAVFGLVADPHIVEAQLADFAGLLPASAFELIQGVVRSVAEKPPGQLGVAFAISTVIALWSARAGIASLMTGLDIACRNKVVRTFVASTIVGLVLTAGGILVASALVATIAGLPAIYAAAPAAFTRASGPFIAWVRWPAIALVMAISLAVLYRFAPSRPPAHWRVFSIGTLLATALWLASSSAFSLYVTWSGSYDATYGSLAGAVVMMLWIWASCVAVLIGATVDDVLEGEP